ncbi:hypothetical protein RHAL1_01486 [Beijerinckiaceae bacterium RH AL1]|nr:cell envelope integrity EipB family protein [Beijerinckiaceae bacterium]VVB44885.1 hypothetical protein RHCH11_RHCH11_01450 [Beijerinckiaceae bacterium RH CH11]VVB44964.1 hypothetical protein RHAL8_01447 [Beijerinckiaceae bacterium RH AL8]VVC54587.1 hypothetical protein RHAL1_01486 [Beijerinckiaceae bacterium RH AL1]
MRVFRSRLLPVLVAAAVSLLVVPAGRAEGPVPPVAPLSPQGPVMPLAGHHATYDLKLVKSVGAKSPTSARGRLLYEFHGSPKDGYDQAFRQVVQIQPAEGTTRLSDMRSATFEKGGDFTFYVKTISQEGSPDIVSGEAQKSRGDILDITLQKPQTETMAVDNKVLFPTEHLVKIIAAAKAGQHLVDARVFDGSDDGKKVFETTTIIGRPITGPAPDAPLQHNAVMAAITRWPVTISYFESGKKDEGPSYTLAFELYENGVSRALRFDYGDFTLGGEMTNLELLPTSTR